MNLGKTLRESLSIKEGSDRSKYISELRDLGCNYNFNKYSDQQLYCIWSKAKAKAEKEQNELDAESHEEVKACPKCGGHLNDGGTCPKCDDSEEDESLEKNKEPARVRDIQSLLDKSYEYTITPDKVIIKLKDIPEKGIYKISTQTYKDLERLGYLKNSIKEDTTKQNNKWVNKGKEGTHGTFDTKKKADAQRKAMFANGFKEGLYLNDKQHSPTGDDGDRFIEYYEDNPIYQTSNYLYFILDEGGNNGFAHNALENLFFDSLDQVHNYIDDLPYEAQEGEDTPIEESLEDNSKKKLDFINNVSYNGIELEDTDMKKTNKIIEGAKKSEEKVAHTLWDAYADETPEESKELDDYYNNKYKDQLVDNE